MPCVVAREGQMANLSSNIDNGAIAERLQQRRLEQPRTRKHKPPLVELSVEEELLALEADGVRVVHHRQPHLYPLDRHTC